MEAYGDGFMWDDIAQANNLENPDNIPAGTKLNLPEKEEAAQQAQPTDVPVATATAVVTIAQNTPVPTVMSTPEPTTGNLTGTSYKVAQGDNLWVIAVRTYGNGYRWVDIARANNLLNPDVIHTGNTLQLPR